MDVYDVVVKLVGPIEPVGETNADNSRFSNIEEMTELVDRLVKDIADVARFNKDRGEYSMKRAGQHAHHFLLSLGMEDY
ncbi:MAG TPA: hypothetical protein DCS09_02590 [Porphyromonadaceae bacterium]|nr:hypothetical protein [Porphyromonadaceae bacterium]